MGFNIIRGCPLIIKPPLESNGIFKIFNGIESFKNLIGDIIPIKNMTSCLNRDSLICYTKCEKAINGFVSNGIISWQQIDKRI